jgi:putative endonuclease
VAYYVYILSSVSRTLYTGVTNSLPKRLHEHRIGHSNSFTRRYNIDRLVYVEETNDVRDAITREKQIKGWTRARKVALIESSNPQWRDLSGESLDRDSSLRSE